MCLHSSVQGCDKHTAKQQDKAKYTFLKAHGKLTDQEKTVSLFGIGTCPNLMHTKSIQMLITVITARSVQRYLARCGCEDTMLGIPIE